MQLASMSTHVTHGHGTANHHEPLCSLCFALRQTRYIITYVATFMPPLLCCGRFRRQRQCQQWSCTPCGTAVPFLSRLHNTQSSSSTYWRQSGSHSPGIQPAKGCPMQCPCMPAPASVSSIRTTGEHLSANCDMAALSDRYHGWLVAAALR